MRPQVSVADFLRQHEFTRKAATGAGMRPKWGADGKRAENFLGRKSGVFTSTGTEKR